MKTYRLLRQSVRKLLGIQTRRALAPISPTPRVGDRICSGDVRLQVPTAMSDTLWHWLSKLGWRKITFRPDRRRYIDISEAWAQRLCEARPEDWSQVLLDATVAAKANAPHPDAFHEVPITRQAHRMLHFGRPKR